jgi:hypothetical protein
VAPPTTPPQPCYLRQCRRPDRTEAGPLSPLSFPGRSRLISFWHNSSRRPQPRGRADRPPRSSHRSFVQATRRPFRKARLAEMCECPQSTTPLARAASPAKGQDQKRERAAEEQLSPRRNHSRNRLVIAILTLPPPVTFFSDDQAREKRGPKETFDKD